MLHLWLFRLVRDRPGLRLWEGVEWQDTASQASVPGETQWEKHHPSEIFLVHQEAQNTTLKAWFVLELKSIHLAFLATIFSAFLKVGVSQWRYWAVKCFLDEWAGRLNLHVYFYIWSHSSDALSHVFRTETLPASTVRWNSQTLVSK